jgi:hypothetical protein
VTKKVGRLGKTNHPHLRNLPSLKCQRGFALKVSTTTPAVHRHVGMWVVFIILTSNINGAKKYEALTFYRGGIRTYFCFRGVPISCHLATPLWHIVKRGVHFVSFFFLSFVGQQPLVPFLLLGPLFFLIILFGPPPC